jgi:hypothetical protein
MEGTPVDVPVPRKVSFMKIVAESYRVSDSCRVKKLDMSGKNYP